MKWDKVFKSGLSKFFKGCFPQNLLSPHLNTLYQMSFANEKVNIQKILTPNTRIYCKLSVVFFIYAIYGKRKPLKTPYWAIFYTLALSKTTKKRC